MRSPAQLEQKDLCWNSAFWRNHDDKMHKEFFKATKLSSFNVDHGNIALRASPKWWSISCNESRIIPCLLQLAVKNSTSKMVFHWQQETKAELHTSVSTFSQCLVPVVSVPMTGHADGSGSALLWNWKPWCQWINHEGGPTKTNFDMQH